MSAFTHGVVIYGLPSFEELRAKRDEDLAPAAMYSSGPLPLLPSDIVGSTESPPTSFGSLDGGCRGPLSPVDECSGVEGEEPEVEEGEKGGLKAQDGSAASLPKDTAAVPKDTAAAVALNVGACAAYGGDPPIAAGRAVCSLRDGGGSSGMAQSKSAVLEEEGKERGGKVIFSSLVAEAPQTSNVAAGGRAAEPPPSPEESFGASPPLGGFAEHVRERLLAVLSARSSQLKLK